MQKLSTSNAQRTRIISALIVAVLFFAGCSNLIQSPSTRDPNQVFVYPLSGAQYAEPFWYPDKSTGKIKDSGLSLDPAYMSDLYSQTVLSMIQAQLVTFNNNLQVIPDAASTWNHSADGKTWTFTIKQGLQWSDGSPLTSQDFAAGMYHDLDPNLCSITGTYVSPVPDYRKKCTGSQPQLAFLQYIQGANDYATGNAKTISGIQTPDPLTIAFTLTDPIAFFPYLMATPASMPLERAFYLRYLNQSQTTSSFTEHLDTGAGQSGPFVVSVFANDQGTALPSQSTTIKFKPNPYWMGNKENNPVNLKGITMPLIPNPNDMYTQYVNGQADFTLVPSARYQNSRQLDDFHEEPALAIDYFGMNFQNPPFDNLQVRQAFDLALNKQYLVDTVYNGDRYPSNHIIPAGIHGYNTNLLNPPNTSASSALTGNQPLAQQFIQEIAHNCQTVYTNDWCPYIVGTPPLNTSIRQLTGNASCPDYLVGARTDINGNLVSTQKTISVYTPSENPARVAMTNASVQSWASILCLNVQMNSTLSFGNLLGQIGVSPTIPMWTLGYVVDYPDPQDFTTNQFTPNSGNDNENIGVNGANADLMQAFVAADHELDPIKRDKMYATLEQQLVNMVAWIPFAQEKYNYRVKSYVQQFSIPPSEIMPDQSWPQVFLSAH